ncbi:uncharacterized protein RCO7_09268 [Rhynchosporium graminicola]|uniref:GP-PDE domain-containing protein n=1 Tax=Rhynchosporium graminicola TaxID=2792576 RepID=A0A1E1KYD5_9HELO|nr:uncharacterized protein RCO7_09268 [Rhynchosporium commune]
MNRIYGKLIRCRKKLGTWNLIQSNRANSKDKLASPIVAHRLDLDHQAVAAIISENHLVMQTGFNRNLLEFGATHGMINLCTQVLSGVTSVKDHVLLKNEAGLTSVHIAVVNGYVEIARLLLSIIDKPFVGNPDNLLHIALRNQDDEDMLRLSDYSSTLELTQIHLITWDGQQRNMLCSGGHLAVGDMFPVPTKHQSPAFQQSLMAEKVYMLPGMILLEHGLMLTVSTSESAVSVQRMLPLLDDPVDDTFVFFVENSEDITVLFNIHEGRADPDGQATLIGAGIALLEAHNNCVGIQHGLLMREQSVAIMYKGTLKLLGTISFSYTIIKPYHQLQSPKSNSKSLRTTGSAKIVGHRGLGQNCQDNFLRLGENTIESSRAAAKQGADYVEVYVQVTRVLVPILFHDYSLSESGTDVPIHEITLNQFMHMSDSQSSTLEPTSMLGGVENYEARDNVQVVRVRSGSVAFADERETERMKNRMRHPVDYQDKGFKPNTRGDFVHGTFTTLQDTLGKLPEHIGVDMEIKYPRPHEASQAGNALTSIDINVFADTVLDVIARFGKGRHIILSSIK